MKRLLNSLACASVILLTTSGIAFADASDRGCLMSGGKAKGCDFDILPYPKKAPEIDAASATVPLVLLTGLVLLIKERSRSRRSFDSDK